MKYVPIFVTLLILLAAFVAYFSCEHCKERVEGRLNTAARLALDGEGYAGVQVNFDRLDAHLSGQVSSDAAKAEASKIVANLSGARLLDQNNKIQSSWIPSVDTPTPFISDPNDQSASLASSSIPERVRPTPQPEAEITVIEPSQTSKLGLLWDSESIRINGIVPDESTKHRILAVFQARKPGFRLIDNLKVDPTAQVAGWAPRLPALLARQLEATDSGAIQLGDSRLVLRGTVKDESTKSSLGTNATELVEDPSLVENLLTVVQSPASVPQISTPEAETEAVKDQETIARSFKKNAIYFASGRRSLSAEDIETIKSLADSVKALPDNVQIFVGGYADSSGSPEANRRLSIARATAVKSQLVVFGVPEKRLVVNSFGAERTSQEDRWKSRRVELSIRQD